MWKLVWEFYAISRSLSAPHLGNIYKSKYKKVGVLPIQTVKSNVLSIGLSSERDKKFSL